MCRQARPCRACPERDKYGVCVIRGKWMSADAPSCEYGRRQMDNETRKARRKESARDRK